MTKEKYTLYVWTNIITRCEVCDKEINKKKWEAVKPTHGDPYQFTTPRQAWKSIFGVMGIDTNMGVGEQYGIDPYGHNAYYKVSSNK